MIEVFREGKYETGMVAGWADGDWNDNALFDSNDLIAALQTGTYEQRILAAVDPEKVPPPSNVSLLYDPLSGQLWVQAVRLGWRITEFAVPLVYLDEERSFGGSLDLIFCYSTAQSTATVLYSVHH